MQPNDTIDLRSDTVTRPTPAMREAMARAEVGDDQYGEDPTINLLQERLAALLGKHAALWLPSGTMANQVAAMTLARPGDEIITAREAHAGWHEVGAAAANAGVQIVEVGSGGCFTREQFEAAIKPRRVAGVPGNHGGRDREHAQPRRRRRLCAGRGRAHLRAGARAWHCELPRRRAAVECSRGQRPQRGRTRRAVRPGVGGVQQGPRRAGRLAARRAARLDRSRASGTAAAWAARCGRWASSPPRRCMVSTIIARGWPRTMPTRGAWPSGWRRARAVQLDLASVQTNIVVFQLKPGAPDAAAVVAQARQRGVWLGAFGVRTVRAVTHLDVSAAMCDVAALRLVALLG